MKLHEISPAAGSTTAPKRLGRGVGSGLGKTSGKGHKGGKARSGGGKGPGFEGGQMKLIMRIPKRGFTNKFAKEYVAINVSALEAFEDGAVVDALALKNAGIVKNPKDGIKVLGDGYGKWDDSTTASVMSNLMSAYASQGIDGILSEGGGGHAIVQSLVENGIDPATVPISEGEMFNSFMKDWVEMDLDAFCTAQPPYLAAAAVDVALKVLNGEEVEPMTYVDLPTCSSKEEAEEKWYQPDQEGGFVCDWTPLYSDRMYAILPADYPTDGRGEFPIEAYGGKEFLMPYGRFDIDVNAALSPKGVKPIIRPCYVDDETVIRMVSKGLGITMMTEIMMRGRTQGVRTLPVSPKAGRELGMGMHLSRNTPEEILRLRACVLDFTGGLS